jgi:fido (protein-threonine AMPylation protein)
MAVDRTDARREAAHVSNRIRELAKKPVVGRFDREHLQQVHAYLFQDVPSRQPGKIRGDTDGWMKQRELEGASIRYPVHYESKNVALSIEDTLNALGGPSAFVGISTDAVAVRLARLYGDLDYAHGFHEGNSRTLRFFTRSLARQAGYKLDWAPTDVGPEQRDHLYMARDLAVLERAYPKLEGDFKTKASETLTSLRDTGLSLEGIIQSRLHKLERTPEVSEQRGSRAGGSPHELESSTNDAPRKGGAEGLLARVMRERARHRGGERGGRSDS